MYIQYFTQRSNLLLKATFLRLWGPYITRTCSCAHPLERVNEGTFNGHRLILFQRVSVHSIDIIDYQYLVHFYIHIHTHMYVYMYAESVAAKFFGDEPFCTMQVTDKRI